MSRYDTTLLEYVMKRFSRILPKGTVIEAVTPSDVVIPSDEVQVVVTVKARKPQPPTSSSVVSPHIGRISLVTCSEVRTYLIRYSERDVEKDYRRFLQKLDSLIQVGGMSPSDFDKYQRGKE